MDTPIIPQKRCSKCGELKPATSEYFHLDKHGLFGFKSYCRICKAAYNKQRWENDPNVRATSKENGQKWRQENKAYWNEYNREYRKSHREQIAAREKIGRPERAKRYRLEHPEQVRKSCYKWRDNNPDKWKAILKTSKHTRRARIRNAEGVFTHQDVIQQYKWQNGKCWWCECDLGDSFHPDHRIPLSRGGSNKPNNIVVTCVSCNLKKNNKMPWEWCGRLL